MISGELYAQLHTLVERNERISLDMLPRLRPWAASVLLSYPKAQADGIVLDTALQNAALAQGKKVLALEDIEEQFNVFSSLKEEDAIAMLQETLEEQAALQADERALISYYLAQNLRGIWKVAEHNFARMGDKKLADHLKQGLIDERNERIVTRARAIMAQSPVFIAVGALHLPGNKGIVSLLEAQGFQFAVTDLP